MEPKALFMQGKCYTTEYLPLNIQLDFYFCGVMPPQSLGFCVHGSLLAMASRIICGIIPGIEVGLAFARLRYLTPRVIIYSSPMVLS